VLFPIPSSNPGAAKSSKKTAKDRLRLFKQGHIRELYDEGNAVISKSPKEMAQAPARLQKSAQLAIGLDNVKTANVRLTKDAPVAIINATVSRSYRSFTPSLSNAVSTSCGAPAALATITAHLPSSQSK